MLPNHFSNCCSLVNLAINDFQGFVHIHHRELVRNQTRQYGFEFHHSPSGKFRVCFAIMPYKTIVLFLDKSTRRSIHKGFKNGHNILHPLFVSTSGSAPFFPFGSDIVPMLSNQPKWEVSKPLIDKRLVATTDNGEVCVGLQAKRL